MIKQIFGQKILMFKNFQLLILMIIFIIILIAVGKLIVNPDISKREVRQYQFPANISLSEWQLIKRSNSPQKIDYERVIANHQYLYQKNNLKLEIDTFYVVGTRGTYHGLINLENSIQNNQKKEFLLSVRNKDNLNYALFIKDNQAHLVSCINPMGGSTITTNQFVVNRYKNDLTFNNVFLWLKGEKASIDLRCLWTHLSLPINDNNSVDSIYNILENTWFSWYDYWQKNFPSY